ncbi:MAG: universal stress protein [Dehalococcoidia bacterium]
MVERILVPLDGSELAETVLPYVRRLAISTGAGVRLVTIVKGESNREQASSYLRSRQDRLGLEAIETSVTASGDGEAEAILSEAESWNADLIAMSTHGRSGAMRWVYGSVADKVIHATTRPLLLVRSRPEEPIPEEVQIDRVLVPLDGSDLSLGVLPYVEELAKALGASLVLFGAVTPPQTYTGVEIGAMPATGLIDEMMAQNQQSLTALAKEIEERGVKTRTMVTTGYPVSEIVRAAQEVEAGLIAVATHGRSGVNRWIMGSVADGVVRRSSLPCLIVRPEGLAAQE